MIVHYTDSAVPGALKGPRGAAGCLSRQSIGRQVIGQKATRWFDRTTYTCQFIAGRVQQSDVYCMYMRLEETFVACFKLRLRWKLCEDPFRNPSTV